MRSVLVLGCSGAVKPSVSPDHTSTPTSTEVTSETQELPHKVNSTKLSHNQLIQWVDWFAWELAQPPDGPMLRMTYDFTDTLVSCDRSFTEDQAKRTRAENNQFSAIPYSYKWNGTSALHNVAFWGTLRNPTRSASRLAKARDIVGDFMWKYQLSVTRLIGHYGGIGCEETVDLLQELLYPHYDTLPRP